MNLSDLNAEPQVATATLEPEVEVVNTGGSYEPTAGVTPRGTTGYSRQVPWGLGRAVGIYSGAEKRDTTREAMQDAGLDWEVEKGWLYSNDPRNEALNPLDGWKTVQRKDTGKVLGVVKGRYVPIQNRRHAEFNDVLVKEADGERAAVGSAFDDRRVYCVTKLDDIDSPDGGLGSFLVTANSHDGTTSMWTTVVNVRWACTNGLVGLSDKAHTVKIRHTIKAEEQLVEAIRIMAGASSYLQDTTRVMEELLATPMSTHEGERIIRRLMPVPELLNDRSNERSVRAAVKRQGEVMGTWKFNDNLDDVRDTGWGLLNAVAEWNEWTGSHVRRRKLTPMERLLNDTGQDLVLQTRDLILA